MTWHNTLLVGVSIVIVIVIFVAALPRTRNALSIKLPSSMLFALRIALGIFFVILGIIGGFLPIIQGWIFMLLAVLVLFPQSKFAVKAVEKVEPRMPRLVARLRRMGIGVPRDTIRAE